jgi:hypothetical protein
VVENSDNAPSRLTFPLDGPYSTISQGETPPHFKQKECSMSLHMFLLVCMLIVSLVLLGFPHHGPRDTPLYRLKTPSQQVAVVLSALAEGLDPAAAARVFGFRQATITT